jgi:hypothetical protein
MGKNISLNLDRENETLVFINFYEQKTKKRRTWQT